MTSSYKILSLDGGGIRGLITARLLQRLNEHHKIAGWLENVDLLSGTSTGGIIALALAAGKTPSNICDLYKCKGDNIFDKSIIEKIIDIPNFITAKYSNENLIEELAVFFGEIKLGNLPKKVAIPTFRLNAEYDFDKTSAGWEHGWKPKIFHNFEGDGTNKDYSDKDYEVKKVALYTSSAPTYFPVADGYIDGGVFANNPSNIAIAQAIAHNNSPNERARLEDISLLSIGSGVTLQSKKEKDADWGSVQWVSPLIDILMEGVAGIADFQAKQLLGQRYSRLQIYFNEENKINLDDVGKLADMDIIANSYDISETAMWIDQNWC